MLHSLWPRREFRLPTFELAQLEFGAVASEPAELVLDQVAARIAAVQGQLRRQSAPTPGELQRAIEHHLDGAVQREPGVAAADELRNALAELRASFR